MITILSEPWKGDPPYHPDSMPNVCLDETFVKDVFKELSLTNDDVITLISTHENIHRTFVFGNLTRSERDRLSKQLLEDYRQTHDRWVHYEKDYNKFYYKINNGYWDY